MNKLAPVLIVLEKLTMDQGDGLTDLQHGHDLHESAMKKDLMLDLLTIMTDRVKVMFKTVGDTYDTEIGRWCTICK